MKKKYEFRINHSEVLEAGNDEEALLKFWDDIKQNNQTAETFLNDNLKVREVFLASELSEEGLEEVLENERFAYINTEDSEWAYRDEAPFLKIKTFGIEIDTRRMNWSLEHPYRQLYFDCSHNGAGSKLLGIRIADKDKLVEKLRKDLKISAKVAKAMKDGGIEIFFETSYFGGGDGKTYLQYIDKTEKAITEEIPNNLVNLDIDLQKWFEDNVVNYLLESFQKDYDYLTSKEAIIETLDANEFLFTKDGYRLL